MSTLWEAIGIALVAALVAGLIAVVGLRLLAMRFGWLDRPERHKAHGAPVPLLGGVAVLLAMGIGAVTVEWQAFVPALPIAWWFAIVGAAVVGLVDDHRRGGLSPRVKFGGQCLVAVVAVGALVRYGGAYDTPSAWLFGVMGWAFVVLAMNAFNLIDNSNGSCAGIGILVGAGLIASGVLLADAAGFSAGLEIRHVDPVAHKPAAVPWVAALVTGSLLAFLLFNFPRASIFLGDTGSHLIGLCLSSLAWVLSNFLGFVNAVVFLAVLFAIPLADVAWVVILRRREGRPISVGDREHLAHRLGRRFASSARGVALLWAATGCTSALAVLVVHANTVENSRIVVLCAGLGALGIAGGLMALAAPDRCRDREHSSPLKNGRSLES